MEVQAVSQVNFGYSNELKTLFKKGKLPSVQYDISGRKLTKKNPPPFYWEEKKERKKKEEPKEEEEEE